MKIINELTLPMESGLTLLNIGFVPADEMRDHLFCRVVGRDGSGYSKQSTIGFGSLDHFCYTIQGLDFGYLTPSNDIVGIEDPRAFAVDGEILLFCNEVTCPDGESLYPRPALYSTRSGGTRIAYADNFLAKHQSKAFLPLSDTGYAVVRPMISLGSEGSTVWLVKIRQPGILEEIFDCEPVTPLLPVSEGIALNGISTIAEIDEGILLFYHEVTSLDPAQKEYRHKIALLNKDNPSEILAISQAPFLTPSMFPKHENQWVNGAVYFTNVLINQGKLRTIVSVGDNKNYLVEFDFETLLSSLTQARNFSFAR